MKKNLSRALVLCILASITVSGCHKEASSPDEMNQNIPAQLEEVEDVEVEQVDAAEYAQELSDKTSAENNDETSAGETQGASSSDVETGSSDKETADKEPSGEVVQDSTQENSRNNDTNRQTIIGSAYAISEETETYIDDFGIQTIEKKYVIPYNADIKDIAPATITTNNVQYAIDSIVNPQNFEEKKLVKEQIAKTEDEAKKFAAELEYDEPDGTGVLTLDPNSVKVELNKDEKIPSGTSFVKTYDMAIKDQDKIPQTLKSNGVTYYQGKVTWQNMGDPGTGINGTNGNNAYGTYNTVASSWRATVSYYGTKYTEDKDYKGTATYVGKILAKNSPTNIYVVTYKPNSMVANASGIYYQNYINSMYQKENSKLAASGASDMMGMYSSGYSSGWMGKVVGVLAALLFAFVGALMYVAVKVWKKVNEDPEEVVATVNKEEIPVELIDGEDSVDSETTQ